MDDKFIKELREISRDDRRRSEFMIQGLKETLQERKEEGLLKRWIRRKKTEKKSLKDLIKILTRIKSNNIKGGGIRLLAIYISELFRIH